MKKQYDKKKRSTVQYNPGDKVLLSTENINFAHINKKFTPKFAGPFEVIEKVGQSSYQLQIPASWKIYNVFNEKLLKKYIEPSTSIQKDRERERDELMEIEEETGDYEVERIIDSRLQRGKLQYLIKWKNYPIEESTWEPEDNLEKAKATIAKFHRENPSAPRRIREQLMFKLYYNFTRPNVKRKLYGWDDGKFDEKDLQRLKRNWDELQYRTHG